MLGQGITRLNFLSHYCERKTIAITAPLLSSTSIPSTLSICEGKQEVLFCQGLSCMTVVIFIAELTQNNYFLWSFHLEGNS